MGVYEVIFQIQIQGPTTSFYIGKSNEPKSS